ncbi:hypothetical protein ACEQ8H_008218 [Pleosporales sp. CAS-2024a]
MLSPSRIMLLCLFAAFCLVSTSLALAVHSSTPDPTQTAPSVVVVDLDYIRLQGASSDEYNLTYYRRIPFAASTAGQNRFRAPQPPSPVDNGTYDTDRDFDMCPQRTVNGSEDCLFLGVYSRPWEKNSALRPVLLTFFGGGFIRGSASFAIPPSGYPVLNVSTLNDFVVVYSNYRTNVFGFLPGSKIAAHPDVDLNPGLLDQQAALKWIQKYITNFGGDANNVTIWGQSAGGGSVIAQSIATGNKGLKLFSKAMVNSPFWPKTPRYDAPESEAIYTQTIQDVGCANATDEIACLKSVDVQALRDSALRLSTTRQYTTSSFTFGPVLDDSFLREPLSAIVRRSSSSSSDAPNCANLVLSSYNLHEGENFIPPGFASTNTSLTDGFNSSEASFDSWLRGYLPALSSAHLDQIKALYPPIGTAEELSYNTTRVRAGLVYRDSVLACPARWLAQSAHQGWSLEYTISPAKHASDVQYWNTVGEIQKTDALTYQGYAGAMASFVQTGDPNAHEVTNARVVGLPETKTGQQFLVTSTGLEIGNATMLDKRCAFWLDISAEIPV